MSTATAFKYYRTFPNCLSASFGNTFNFVTVSLEELMSFWWNLEDLSFETTGTFVQNINWTTTLGATESLPFTPTSSSRSGSYYSGTTPAREPRTRVCVNQPIMVSRVASATSSGVTRVIDLTFAANRVSDTSYRIGYQVRLSSSSSSTSPAGGVGIFNPAFIANSAPFSGFSGSPASSGTFTILGISFNWAGGGFNSDTSAWTANTASITASSAAYTY